MNHSDNGKNGHHRLGCVNGSSADVARQVRFVDPRVRSATAYIEDHLHEKPANLRLEALANIVRLSPYHFHRLFKKTTGLTPREHLTRRRIERAKTLMRQRPDMTLVQIASHVGFVNSAQLCRLFEKREGITPDQYQDICQNSRIVQGIITCNRMVSQLLEG